jgi:cell division septation protein DedD
MPRGNNEPQVYHALALPEQALSDGGVEILRLGIVNDELYVSALPAFDTPAPWGEVLAEVTKRLGTIYAAQKAGLSKKDIMVQIAEAYLAEMGASPVQAKSVQSKPTQSKPSQTKSSQSKSSQSKSSQSKPAKSKSKTAAKPAARRKKR